VTNRASTVRAIAGIAVAWDGIWLAAFVALMGAIAVIDQPSIDHGEKFGHS
jgi:hypothetical protein